MRKAFLLMIVFCLIGASVGCIGARRENQVSTVDESLLNKEVELYFKQKTITDETTEFTIVYVNTTDMTYTYNNAQQLEELRDGKWYSISDQQDVAALVLNTLAPNETMNDVFYIEEHYDKLEHGTYRIIKQFSDQNGDTAYAGTTFDIQ